MSAHDIEIGDAVVPKDEPDHDVMTVYDFELGYSLALCNWVVGTRMLKAKYRPTKLIKVERRKTRTGR